MKKWNRAFYQPSIPLGKDGRRVTESEEHITLSKDAAKEGMVLLKNEDHILPFSRGTRIALFGKGCIDYVKGGGGSGDVTVSYRRNLYEGFLAMKEDVSVFPELAQFYEKNVQAQYDAGKEPGMTIEPEIPEALLRQAREYTDTAVICICRFSGEGWDRKEDFYLTEEEKRMVAAVLRCFPRVAAVLNIGGMMATDWFAGNAGIQGVLLAWQGGMEGGLAAAELLMGRGNPSGKLSDTFASDFSDYPSSESFHESEEYVNYTEDVFVGYRYFETVPEAKQRVVYPFGYGLSYTSFAISVLSAGKKDGNIFLETEVTNTGTMAGKEVVQVYYGGPGKAIARPARELCAFAKTKALKPGEKQVLRLEFPVSRMSFYDEEGIIKESAWVLEAGEYSFYVGNSVRNAEKADYMYFCPENTVTEQLSKKLSPKSQSEGNDLPPLPWEETECMVPEVRFQESYCFLLPENQPKILFSDVAEGKMSLDEFVSTLPEEDLAALLGGQPNTGVANTYGVGNLPKYGVPNIMTADGPAGLRIAPECGVCTTAWPCATLLACTWDPALVEQIGAAGAAEVKENNIGIWLAPAVNIHRNPLCGRNFEYYSEDPYLTGKIGAAMVQGIQSAHIAATVKHFALNNKETNRKNSDSRASERAIREIYLKGFEIIVKEAQPWAIMSSYNLVNGVHSSENRELLTDILRDEWGFEGLVMTDWWAFSEQYREIKAGNDLKMGCGYPKRLLEAEKRGLISRKEMETAAKRILSLILKID